MTYCNLTLVTEDSVYIRGWFLFGKSAEQLSLAESESLDGFIPKYTDGERPTLVFFHENYGNLGLRIP